MEKVEVSLAHVEAVKQVKEVKPTLGRATFSSASEMSSVPG